MTSDTQYNLAAIRELLLTAFTAEELRRFCLDRPVFQPLLAEFGPNMGLDDMVDRVIDYCRTRFLFDELLTEVKLVRQRPYIRYEPYTWTSRSPSPAAPPGRRPLPTFSWPWMAGAFFAILIVLWWALKLPPFKPAPAPTATASASPTSMPVPTSALSVKPSAPTPTKTSSVKTSDTSIPSPTTPTPSNTPSVIASDTSASVPNPTPTNTFTPSLTKPSPTPITPTPCTAADSLFLSEWSAVRDKLGCAEGHHFTIWVGEQDFEGGWMFWREDTEQIYTIYQGAGWDQYTDTWQEGDPLFSCSNEAPTESPPTPRRGFGKIWCNDSTVRQNLGWATEVEGGFDAPLQRFEHGLLLRATDSTWVLYDDSTWEKQ